MSPERRKSIFITGGSGGMGQATARLFAKQGWLVGVFDVDKERLGEIQSELGAENCISMRLDVTDEAEFREAIAAFGARTDGKMDILFNNAGIAPGSLFEEMPMEMVRRLVDINVMGVVIGTRLALPLLKETEGSLWLSTSSSAATFAQPMRAMYSATKYAVKGLTEALGLEFERFGIRTADLLPGCIDTPMLRNALGQRDGVDVVDDPGICCRKRARFG
jgi:NAD(P)-dependent dehydrogenase (short-subunit alcohol dehydrogenase family)